MKTPMVGKHANWLSAILVAAALCIVPRSYGEDDLRLAAILHGNAESRVAIVDESIMPPGLYDMVEGDAAGGITLVTVDRENLRVLITQEGEERWLYLHGYVSDVDAILASVDPTPTQKGLRLKFKDSSIDLVLSEYARHSGQTLLMSTNMPQSCVTLQSPTDLPLEEYLLGIRKKLKMHGICIMPVDEKHVAVVAEEGAAERASQAGKPAIRAAPPVVKAASRPAPGSTGEAGPLSYAERLRARREALLIKQEEMRKTPGLSGEELQKHLQEIQMDAIRKGLPPLPIPLTKEMDDKLVSEGVIPPIE